MSAAHVHIYGQNYPNSLIIAFQNLLQSNTLVDCILSAEGQYLKAHKFILSASSTYFQSIFNETSDKYPIVILKDVKYLHLKALVEFLYSGEVQVQEQELQTFLEVANTLKISFLKPLIESENVRQNGGLPMVFEVTNEYRSQPCNMHRESIHEEAKKKNETFEIGFDIFNSPLNFSNKQSCIQFLDNTAIISMHNQHTLPQRDFSTSSTPSTSSTINMALASDEIMLEDDDEETAGNSQFPLQDVTHLLDVRSVKSENCNESYEDPGVDVMAIPAPDALDDTAEDEYEVTTANSMSEIPHYLENVGEGQLYAVDNGRDDISSPVGETDSSENGSVVSNGSDDSNSSVASDIDSDGNGTNNANDTDVTNVHDNFKNTNCNITKVSDGTNVYGGAKQADNSSVAKQTDNSRVAKQTDNSSVANDLNDCDADKDFDTSNIYNGSENATDSGVNLDGSDVHEDFENATNYISKDFDGTVCDTTKANNSSVIGSNDKASDAMHLDAKSASTAQLSELKRTPTRRQRNCCGGDDANAGPSRTLRRPKFKRMAPFQCEDCRKVFSSAVYLRKHQSVHTGEQPFKCERCGQAFTHLTKFLAHKRTHRGKRHFRCDICCVTFPDWRKFARHSLIHGERPLQCQYCKKSFDSLASVQQHKLIHSSERPFQCQECDKAFRTSTNLVLHMRVHTGERPYKCKRCPKAFTTSQNLEYHEISVHLGERPFRCNLCPKAFINRTTLAYHERQHTGVSPFRCKCCGKGFALQKSLAKHEIVHKEQSSKM